MRQSIYLLLLSLFTLTPPLLRAGDGMWLPLLLEQLNESEMQALGMKMTAADIYSVNQGSLKDAIVHFGGFCTGEVISDRGLVLTNHHCGYSRIQSHSTIENNYLEDGFWAPDLAGEIPNPGLFVTFIVRMEDITQAALRGVSPDMSETERQSTIDNNLAVIKEGIELEAFQNVVIRPFYHGNQYFMFLTETYNDVRLVAAPPSSIGKFGADTDNWVWPRHTGDFSLFRIYASPDNKPAEYSPDNVPFRPRHHLPISLDGVETGDFTLVFGFPGRTDQYLPAAAMQQRTEVINPVRIGVRDRSLEVIGEAMRRDAQIKIDYASRQASIANGWKKWIGESEGVERTDGIARRRALEAEFRQRLRDDPALLAQYGGVLDSLDLLYAEQEPFAVANNYVREIFNYNVELFRLVNTLDRLVTIYENNGAAAAEQRRGGYSNYLEGVYQKLSVPVDRAVARRLLPVYFSEVAPAFRAGLAQDQLSFVGDDPALLADTLFGKSVLTEGDQVLAMLNQDIGGFVRRLQGDPLYQFVRAVMKHNDAAVSAPYNRLDQRIAPLQRRYMAGLLAAFPERRFYPDANGTLRVSYGQVEGYDPRDAVTYTPKTYLDGVMEKYVPGDYEFDVPDRLRELYENEEYGPYGEAGRMPVCFIGSNHTSGGNSGSPAIDGEGNLVGLNFDRVWEGTMSDINYDRSICRNIMVDIRYVLFLIDKFGGAGHLVEEMTLVRPKAGR
jgi:hypothetical protein